MKVAVFGGSFDPPHISHVLAASYALACGFERVLLPVVFRHAFSKDLTSFEHRVRMTELAFAPLRTVEISTIEAGLPAPSYTVHTLAALQEAHPEWQMNLLIGSDVLAELPRWESPEQVVAMAPLFPLGRAGHPHPKAPLTVLPEISSTALREALKAAWTSDGSLEKANLIGQVPKDVLDYIERHALYR